MTESKKNPKKAKRGPKSPRQRVRTFLRLFGQNDTVLVLINADPDAMASALAVKRLLWKKVRSTLIGYAGTILRLENRTMMELLKIPMVQINKVVPENFNRKILIDSQPDHLKVFGRFTYDAIIDHHTKRKKWNVPYMDIRPRYGATSTILVEYLRGAGIKPSMKLSTAVLYGIKTDTDSFRRDSTEEDVRQFRYVLQHANMNLLRKIERSNLRDSDLEYFQIALQNRIAGKKWHYSHLGTVRSPDICVQIADFFMRVYGMGWSFISGIHMGKLIVILRNDGYRKDAGKLAAHAFGALGSAGGHRGAARAEVPLNALRQEGIEPHDATIEAFVRKRLNL